MAHFQLIGLEVKLGITQCALFKDQSDCLRLPLRPDFEQGLQRDPCSIRSPFQYLAACRPGHAVRFSSDCTEESDKGDLRITSGIFNQSKREIALIEGK
jgi:hypothetical protein